MDCFIFHQAIPLASLGLMIAASVHKLIEMCPYVSTFQQLLPSLLWSNSLLIPLADVVINRAHTNKARWHSCWITACVFLWHKCFWSSATVSRLWIHTELKLWTKTTKKSLFHFGTELEISAVVVAFKLPALSFNWCITSRLHSVDAVNSQIYLQIGLLVERDWWLG